MSFTFAGFPCLDPLDAFKACRRDSLPADSFWGVANSFSCPLGGAPGRGKLLMPRQLIDQLDFGGQGDKFRDLTIKTIEGRVLQMPAVLVTGHAEAITPGQPDDSRAAYVVEIADRRWLEWERGTPLFKAYNCRADNDGAYITATLNTGIAWTWAELLEDLWPSTLGTAPTLPFTPHGTPETFWYQGETKLQAVDHLLTRLACALRYDPVANSFTIVRLGASLTERAKSALAKYDRARRTDAFPKITRTSQLPETIRVQHRVKRPYTDGTLPYYVHDYTVTPTAGELATGTFVLLLDDLIAQYDGSSITNTATLEARRDERAQDWLRKRQYFDTGNLRQYVGILPLHDAVGTRWHACLWKDLGDGAQTELVSAPANSRVLEDWWRHETVDHVANVCPT